MEEIDDEDRPRPGGLKLSDPILLGPEEAVDIPTSEEEKDNLEEII
jgi:hypothetical protein